MRTDYPGSESSRELSLPGTKVLSGNFRSEERKYRGAKSPDTVYNGCVVVLNDTLGVPLC